MEQKFIDYWRGKLTPISQLHEPAFLALPLTTQTFLLEFGLPTDEEFITDWGFIHTFERGPLAEITSGDVTYTVIGGLFTAIPDQKDGFRTPTPLGINQRTGELFKLWRVILPHERDHFVNTTVECFVASLALYQQLRSKIWVSGPEKIIYTALEDNDLFAPERVPPEIRADFLNRKNHRESLVQLATEAFSRIDPQVCDENLPDSYWRELFYEEIYGM